MSKVLIINGSPKANGNTALAIKEMVNVFNESGVEVTTIQVGNKDIRGCVSCGSCGMTGKCAFDDIVNEAAELLEEADGVVIASPVYYSSPNGTLISFLDRLFYSSSCDKRMKVGASLVCARRGGCTASFDVLNKYFTISNMPIAPSQYWNMIHGNAPGEAQMDDEGRQTMRVLARNMIFLMKSIELGKKEFGLPETETRAWTNFIH